LIHRRRGKRLRSFVPEQQDAGRRTGERTGDAGHDREGAVQSDRQHSADRSADHRHKRVASIDLGS
jgi:hypothetical protein